MEYLIHLAILVCLYLILAQGFNLTFGLGRLFNLAHVAGYAIGAYTTALMSTELSMSIWACIPASMFISGLFALFIGAISLRLSNDYFAIGTLAFSAVVNALLVNWKSFTRGVLGIPGIPRPAIGAIDFYQNINFLVMIVIINIFVLGFLYILFNSAFSRGLRSIAEYELAASALGKDVRELKNLSFFIASAIAGLAGSLFAYYINYIDPSSFELSEMIFVLTIVVVGRPGSFWGVIGATFFLVLLPEPLRFIEIPPGVLGPMRQLLYSLIMFAIVFINRERLFPVARSV